MNTCKVLSFFLLLASAARVVQADSPPPAIGEGNLISISAVPDQVKLVGADASQQLVVTGRFSNEGVRDLTRDVAYRSLDPRVARVSSDGFLTPTGNGSTEILAQSEQQSTKIRVQVEGMTAPRLINFANEIVPILTKLSCNNGGCHGKADGQNGFKLSLLGFDPVADYEALVHQARGRRIELSAPAQSLLLIKPTGRLGHGGGKPLSTESPEYKLLLRWIGSGAPFGKPDDPRVVSISVSPGHRILSRQAGQQIRVTANYSDGSMVDVTRRAEYKSNDGELLDVTINGLIETSNRFGEGSVMIRYLGHVAVFRATIPLDSDTVTNIAHKPANFIDELVFAKVSRKGIELEFLVVVRLCNI